ncbi:hypothetical protein [Citrobacter gillenii]
MNDDSPAPNRPLVASLLKGPFFCPECRLPERQVKKTAG